MGIGDLHSFNDKSNSPLLELFFCIFIRFSELHGSLGLNEPKCAKA